MRRRVEAHVTDVDRLFDVLDLLRPAESKPNASFFSTSFATLPEAQMPPGNASCSSLAATFTLAVPVLAVNDYVADIVWSTFVLAARCLLEAIS